MRLGLTIAVNQPTVADIPKSIWPMQPTTKWLICKCDILARPVIATDRDRESIESRTLTSIRELIISQDLVEIGEGVHRLLGTFSIDTGIHD